MNKSSIIKSGIQKGFEDGTSRFAGKVCYGYCKNPDGSLVIDKDQAAIVAEIFHRYLSSASLGGIADWLKNHHIPSPSGKNQWNRQTIDKLLSNA